MIAHPYLRLPERQGWSKVWITLESKMSETFLPEMMFSIALLLLIVTPILAVFLRLAIALANRIIGPQQPSTAPALIDIPNTALLPSNDSNPFAPPRTVSIAVERDRMAAIPMPTLLSALGLVIIAELLSSALFFAAISSVFDGSTFLPPLLGQTVSSCLPVFSYALLLPTSLRRAAIVYLIQLAMALIFFGVIFAAAWTV